MPIVRSLLFPACFLTFLGLGASTAGGATPAPAAVYRGVITASHFDISPPLRELALLAEAHEPSDEPPDLSSGLEGALGPQDADPVVQGSLGALAMPGTIANFTAFSNLCSCSPPSPSMDVGPNHVVVMANLHFAVFSKSGTLLLGPLSNNTLWAGFGGSCQTQNAGQPNVIYDQAADRWILTQSTGTAPHSLCIAVSTTGDPGGTYFRYSVSLGTTFADVPKYSVWPDAYYVSTREFDGPFIGVGAYAINRAQLLAGNPATQVISFLAAPGATPYNVGDGLVPADLDGSAPPPTGSPAFFLGSMDNGGLYGAPQDALTLWRFHADFATPANSSFTLAATIPVSSFDSMFPFGPGGSRDQIPQPATTRRLDHLGYRQRVLPRVAYRNLGTHQSLVANQSVEAGPDLSGIRWYELRDPNGAPFVYQQGTYAPGLTDGIHRWAGSLAMDRLGNIALGYSVSNTATFPGIRYTGRLVNDVLGTLPQGEGVVIDGGGSQTASSRWGDYSWMSADPDNCTFWYIQEYLPVTSSNGWSLRVASFRFPNCTTVGVEEGAPIPGRTELSVSSPARGRVEIRFAVTGADPGPVRLDVFDVAGRRVQMLVDESLGGGRYRVSWDGSTLGGERRRGGVYKVRLRAGAVTEVRTVVLLN